MAPIPVRRRIQSSHTWKLQDIRIFSSNVIFNTYCQILEPSPGLLWYCNKKATKVNSEKQNDETHYDKKPPLTGVDHMGIKL